MKTMNNKARKQYLMVLLNIIMVLALSSCGSTSDTNVNVDGESNTPASDSNTTQITIDGSMEDWTAYQISGSDPSGDNTPGSPDLGEMRAFSNETYFYMFIEFIAPGEYDHFYFNINTDDGTDYQLTLFGDGSAKIENKSTNETLPVEAEFTSGAGYEFKFPLSAVNGERITNIRANIWLGSGNGDNASTSNIFVVAEIEGQPSSQVADVEPDSNPEEPIATGAIESEAGFTFDQDLVDEILAAHGGESLSQNQWVRLGGPPGGLGYDIRVNTQDPNIWYVTDAFSGIHKSIDSGITWFSINEGIGARSGRSGDDIPVFSMTIDINNPDILWVGLIGTRGLYRSDDAGNNWESLVSGIIDQDITIRSITVEPGNSDIVYFGAELNIQGDRRGFIGTKTEGVIYKSENSGMSWTRIWHGDSLVRYILIDPNDVSVIYASTGIFDREAANVDPQNGVVGGVGVLKSTDGGKSWAQVNNGLQNLYIGSLAMHPNDSRILLAAAGHDYLNEGGGIYLTRNGGEIWEKVISGSGFYMSVAFHQTDPDYWYASGGFTGFYTSLDGGATWNRYVTESDRWNPDGYRPALPIDIQPDPRNPQRIFVNNYGGGNYLSEDGGQTWRSASEGYSGAIIWDVTIHPDNPAIVYANGRSGLFISENGGRTWKGITPQERGFIQDGPTVEIDPSNPYHVIASEMQNGWLFESKDGGLNWVRVSDAEEILSGGNVHQQSGVYTIAIAPSNPEVVYAGYGTTGCLPGRAGNDCSVPSAISLATSRDGGTSWEFSQSDDIAGLSISKLVVDSEDETIIWAATDKGVFQTLDGGLSWEGRNDGLGNYVAIDLLRDPFDPSKFILGTARGGIYLSEDNGYTWKSSSVGLDPNESISSIVASPLYSGVYYASSLSSGVFVSEDGGVSWHLLNNGLTIKTIVALDISSDGTTLYAASEGQGVFRLSLLTQEEFDKLSNSNK